jgi:hypothetical protein
MHVWRLLCDFAGLTFLGAQLHVRTIAHLKLKVGAPKYAHLCAPCKNETSNFARLDIFP